MSQSKMSSLTESITNVSSGFVISYLFMTFVINPVYGLNLDAVGNLEITVLFTLVSLFRLYVMRRIFNNLNGRQ